MSDLAREAEWLVKEETEIAVARREGYVLSPEFFRRAPVETTVGLVMASLLGMAFVNVVVSHGYGIDVVLLAVAGLSLGLIPLARHWEKRQEASREADREMRESFGRGGRFVSMIVLQGDAPTGEDRGMLWFEDGRLYFSGHRTSFGLVPDQVREPVTLGGGAPYVRNEINLLLDREGAVGPLTVSLGLFLPSSANLDYAFGKLKADLDAWKKGRAAGSGQWPPLALGPGVISERRLVGKALTRTLLPPLAPALAFLAVAAPSVAMVAYVLATFAFGLSPGGALLWRAYRDRRKLGRAS